jgi:hypothetical protein
LNIHSGYYYQGDYMAGPYAHITLLHELMRPERLESVFSPSSHFYGALTAYLPYATLGSVSPDYPNLARDNGTAAQWADAMHYTRACAMMSSGITRIRGSHGAVRDKQTAWLLGYSAHVAADVTIHPIVQAKVGVYAENQRQHRICEMNQDSYIYRRMNLGEIGESDSFALTVARCGDVDNKTVLDRDIVSLWQGMLEDTHPERYAAHPPSCASWHRAFIARASDCRAGEVRLFPLSGVIAAKMGLAYPAFEAVDRQFIDEQLVPSVPSYSLGYDAIFAHAADNIAAVWSQVEQAVCGEDQSYIPAFGEWNLDSGRDEHDKLVFWE